MIWTDQRFGTGNKSSEDFQTCGRTIKTGLIAVGRSALAQLHQFILVSPSTLTDHHMTVYIGAIAIAICGNTHA